MTTIAVIGLGSFGCRIVEELIETQAELIILDRDREIVEKYKNSVVNAYITDAISEETLKKVIPLDINAAIVDLGSQLESSILVTNHLKKMGIQNIVIKARSDEHGEILKLVGATKIIYPDLDAAIHVVPLLLSSTFLSYMQLSENFAIAEVKVRKDLEGKTLMESLLRQSYGINVIGYRKKEDMEIQNVSMPSMVLEPDMILLVSGENQSIQAYSEQKSMEEKSKKDGKIFKHLLRRK